MASGERVAAFAQFVERALESPLFGLVVGVLHVDPLADDDVSLREGFGNLDPIPLGSRQQRSSDRERQDRRRSSGQQQRAGLR